MERRTLVLATAAVLAAYGYLPLLSAEIGRKARRPIIIYTMTDQQSASMMSCAGNTWLNTPAMDYLAANGTRFERAYTTNPCCVPARVGMMTGWFPDTFGVRANRSGHKFKDVGGRTEYAQTNIGAQLKRAGYGIAYASP